MLGVRLSCDGLQCGADTASGDTRRIYRDSGLWITSYIATCYANSIRGNLVASLTSESSVVVQVWSPGTSYPAGDSAYRYCAGAWPLTARLVASDATAGAQLGTAVALSELGVVASAPYAVGHARTSNAGAVYAFDQASGLIFADGFADGTGRWSVIVP